MALDISSLQKVVALLDNALKLAAGDRMQELQQDERELIKAGVIQNFEFTYEVSWKTLKRYLEMSSPNPAEIDNMSFADLIRTGCENNILLSDLSAWQNYRRARGITSHVYDMKKAEEVLAVIPGFLREAKYLLAKLQERLGKL